MTTSPNDRRSPPVVVVGAGPTGVAAAILLAQYDIPVVVLERHHGVYPLPRAVHLDDEVHRILQQTGVGEAFAEMSRPGRGMRLLDARHRVLARFDRPATGPHGYPQANMFDQPDLERLLRTHLAGQHPEVAFRTGVEVVAVAPVTNGAGASVRFRDLTTDAVQTLTASAVLGCDGANSVVRAAVGGTWKNLRFDERWLVVDGRCSEPLSDWDGVDQILAVERPATFMRIGDERYRWEFRIRPGEDVEVLTSPESLSTLLVPWTAGVPRDQLQLIRASSYTFRARVASRWRRGPILLLGDAAHLTPPFVGQGLGAGLRDASNLAWKLARVLAGDAPDALLDSYEAERRRHVTHQIRLARTVGWALAGGGEGRRRGVRRLVQQRVLPPALRLLGRSSRMVDRVSPPLRGSALTRGRRRRGPTRLIGTLVPQPDVAVDGGGTKRLDEVLGLGPAVLSLSDPDTDLRVFAGRIGARVLQVTDDGGALRRWMEDAGVAAVAVRPDRVVLGVARGGTRAGRELARSAARELVTAERTM